MGYIERESFGIILALLSCEMKKMRAMVSYRRVEFLVCLLCLGSIAYAESDPVPVLLDTALPPALPSSLLNLELILLPGSPIPEQPPPVVAHTASPVVQGQTFIGSGIKVSGTGRSLFNISLASLVVLNAADYFSTLEALRYPGVQEGNLMMKPIVKDPYAFAAVKIGFTALTCYSLKRLYKKNRPLAWAISIASGLAYSYVVSNNLRIIQRCRTR